MISIGTNIDFVYVEGSTEVRVLLRSGGVIGTGLFVGSAVRLWFSPRCELSTALLTPV